MADEGGFEDLAESDDPDVGDLEALEEEDDLLDDDAIDLDEEVLDEEVLVEDVTQVEEGSAAAVERAPEEEEEEEDDDVLDPDDVEAGLDVILKDRMIVVDDEDDDDEDNPDADERGDASTKVLPKRPDEFVCQSCFLLKHPSQLADPARLYCRDCV